jgi:hypothetical protein
MWKLYQQIQANRKMIGLGVAAFVGLMQIPQVWIAYFQNKGQDKQKREQIDLMREHNALMRDWQKIQQEQNSATRDCLGIQLEQNKAIQGIIMKFDAEKE